MNLFWWSSEESKILATCYQTEKLLCTSRTRRPANNLSSITIAQGSRAVSLQDPKCPDRTAVIILPPQSSAVEVTDIAQWQVQGTGELMDAANTRDGMGFKLMVDDRCDHESSHDISR